MKLIISGSWPVQAAFNLIHVFQWIKNGYVSPSPHFVKQAVLIRNSIKSAAWVETGTYLGSTTKKLQKLGCRVISIEPQSEYYSYNQKKFRKRKNVELLHGTSEAIFPSLIPSLNGDFNFWLDGHFSGGDTFKGTSDTPILNELQVIEDNILRFGRVTIFVDDIRCFSSGKPQYAHYPELGTIVSWANKNDLSWSIEHDIFIAKSR
jgi:hypothetical protein